MRQHEASEMVWLSFYTLYTHVFTADGVSNSVAHFFQSTEQILFWNVWSLFFKAITLGNIFSGLEVICNYLNKTGPGAFC